MTLISTSTSEKQDQDLSILKSEIEVNQATALSKEGKYKQYLQYPGIDGVVIDEYVSPKSKGYLIKSFIKKDTDTWSKVIQVEDGKETVLSDWHVLLSEEKRMNG